LDGNLALGCGAGTDYPLNTYISMYARTSEVLEPITFVLACPTVVLRLYLVSKFASA